MNNVVKNSKMSPKKSVTAKQQAKSNLTKRKNPDWDNLDRGYRYLTQDMKLPHDQAVAVMGNVVEESQGDYKSVQKNGGGRGLIQWDGRKAPNGRYSQWGSIWASVAKPANVYDSTTDTVKNYWAPWGGLKGDKVRQKFIKAPLKEKARIYAESYLRPGKPRIADRQLSTMQLDSIYNPKIKDIIVQKDGGILEFLKNGSGIHIKEKNKGKFTSYCGGKVTDECIRKAKASGNPTLVKRATFAANVRKWKHKDGGKAFVSGVNVLDSNPKLYKYIKKAKLGTFLKDNSQELFSIASNLYNIFDIDNKTTNYQNSSNKQIALGKEAILNNVGDVSSEVQKRVTKLKEQNPDQHFGDLDIQMLTNQIIQERRAQNQQEADMFEQQEKFKQLEAMNALQGTTSDSYGNLIEALGGISGNILNNKKLFSSKNSNSNLNFNTKIEPKLTTNNYTTNNSTDFFKTGIMGGYTNSPFYGIKK